MDLTAGQDTAIEDVANLRNAAKGDVRSFELIYHRHGAASLAHATSILRDRHLAQDAVQEAFIDLWRTAEDFDESRCTVAGWLHTLTHRKAIDKVRFQQRRQADSLEVIGDPSDPSQDPVGPALTAALSQQALRALRALPLGQRRAVVLAYWGGYTMTEIAKLEQIPIGTVKTRIRTALASLRTSLLSAPPTIATESRSKSLVSS